MTHHVDSLFSALAVLASHGPIKQRLIRAYEENLDSIEENELPDSVRESFSSLKRSMHAVAPANGEGRVCASVRKMSKDEADHCAKLMVDICADLSRSAEGSDSAQIEISERAAVPPFLVRSG